MPRCPCSARRDERHPPVNKCTRFGWAPQSHRCVAQTPTSARQTRLPSASVVRAVYSQATSDINSTSQCIPPQNRGCRLATIAAERSIRSCCQPPRCDWPECHRRPYLLPIAHSHPTAYSGGSKSARPIGCHRARGAAHYKNRCHWPLHFRCACCRCCQHDDQSAPPQCCSRIAARRPYLVPYGLRGLQLNCRAASRPHSRHSVGRGIG